MKKHFKILSLGLAAMTAFSLATAGLVACGDDEPASGGTEKIESVEAWKAAFDFKDVTNATITFESTAEGGRSTHKYDGNKVCREYTSTGENGVSETRVSYTWYKPDEPYDENDPEMGSAYYYSYNETTKKWAYSKGRIYDMDTVDADVNDAIRDIGVQDMFDKFEYDGKAGVYKFKGTEFPDLTELKKAIVVFKDKKVNKVEIMGTYNYEYEEESGSEEVHVTVTVNDIGKTKVNIPEDAELETN